MHISCEKCSTTYILDEALIPPQGTPVQCTRCGHVFTAMPGGDPVAPVALPKEKAGSSTMMFGGGAAPAPPPAAPSKPAGSQTMVFGAAPPVAAAPKPNQTMVFGSKAPAAPPVGNQTLAFGSAPTPRPAAAPQVPGPNQTMVFGSAPKITPPQPTKPQSPKANQTMVFGSRSPMTPQVPEPLANTKPNQTMVFGNANAAVSPPAAPARSAAEQAQLQAKPNQTMMFGGGPAVIPLPGAQKPAEPPKNQTMMFGKAPDPRPTPRVTPENAAPAGYAAADQPTENTERIEMAGDAPMSEQAKRDSTQRFAMSDAEQPTAVAGPLLGQHIPLSAERSPPAVDNSTLVTDPAGMSVRAQRPASFSEVMTDNISLPESDSVELPPEQGFQHLEGDAGGEVDDGGETDFEQMRASNRRTSIAVGVFLFIALMLGVTLIWFMFGKAMVNKGSTEILQRTQDALMTMRKDDQSSRKQAIDELNQVITKFPDSVEAVEAHAALVLALSFSTDDLKAQQQREEAEAQRALEIANKGNDTLNREVSVQRSNVANAAAVQAKRAANASGEQLRGALKTLEDTAAKQPLNGSQSFALVRAKAMAAAVMGDSSAIALAEESRQKSPSPDNWSDLALPEYVINGGSSYDDALKQLETLVARDNTFIRAYVLAARIDLLRRDEQSADERLRTVLSFHPQHEAAKQLQAWISSRQQ